MRKQAIPVNQFGNTGFSIERFSFSDFPATADMTKSERHDRHTFFLIENGSVNLEIDFHQYEIKAPAVFYIHPDQVHRILGFKNVTAIAWALVDEQTDPAYLRRLQNIAPTAPAALNADVYDLFIQLSTTSLKLAENLKLAPALLNSLHALTYLVIITYTQKQSYLNRFEAITQEFKRRLEQNFTCLKRPADYAGLLNISVPYLNECVKHTSGFSVTYHILQRIILEAKRLLVHSVLSVKEISVSLGFDDYPYFCRLFRRITGTTPVKFKNHD